MAAQKAREVAIFDFDRTITRRGTFTPFLLFACRGKPSLYVRLPLAAFPAVLYLTGAISRKRLKERMMGLFLAGRSRAEIATLAKNFIVRLLEKGIYSKAREAIQTHKGQGHLTGIATASMDFYMDEVKEALGLDFLIATRSRFDSSAKLLPEIPGENCYSAAKARRVAAFLKRLKPAPKEVWFYSDHATDLPTFDLATHKVAVNPGAKLAKAAKGKGWTVEWWD